VTANLPETRTPSANETPEEKTKKDGEFNKQLEEWKTRLVSEQKLERWIFLVSDWSLDPLLKARTDFVKKAEASPTPHPSSPVPPAASPTPETSSPTPTASPSNTPEATATPTITPQQKAE